MKKIFITTLALVAVWAHAQINLTPDSNFGNNSTVNLGTDVTAFLSYHFLNDKIMVQNYDILDPNFEYCKITMLNNDGSLDSSFGTGGSFLFPKNYNANGDVDFVHNLTSSHLLMFSGRKYLHNGTLDQTYGNNGQSQIHPLEIYRKVLPNGKLLVRTETDFHQYTQTGNLDLTFGNNGTVPTYTSSFSGSLSPSFDFNISNVSLLGNNILEYNFNFSMLRKVNFVTGVYDTTYGINGNGQYIIGNTASIIDFQIFNDLSTINYLFDQNNTTQKYLTKTLSTGLLDTAFGTNGKITLPSSINGINL